MKHICFALLLLAALTFVHKPAHAAEECAPNLSYCRYYGTSAGDDVLLFTADARIYDACMLMSTTGAVDVEASLDGTNYSTAIKLQKWSVAEIEDSLVTTAGAMFAVTGRFLGLRVRQNGATSAAASLFCWKR